MTSVPQIPLTFGIELEFVCVRPETLFHPEHEEPFPGCDYAVGAGPAIWKALLQHGIPAVGWESIEDDLVDDAPSHSRWRVESDQLYLSDEEKRLLPDGYVEEAIEISSRKLRFFTDDWRRELAAVLEVLRQVENRGCRFITNASTGLHLHVCLDHGEFLPLRVAKNVFQLTTAFERLIDQLHGASRVELPAEDPERHVYYPLSFFHTYGEKKRSRSSFLLDRLRKIELAKSYEDVGDFFGLVNIESFNIDFCNIDSLDSGNVPEDLMVTGHSSCVNFDNLFPCPEVDRYAETLTGTIEFRQHTGTLDFLDIVAWTTLTCKIVLFCGTARTSDFLDLIIRSVDPEFTLDKFLTEIGCPEDVKDHYRNKSVIGVLGQDSDFSGSRIEMPVDALIEQNDHECEQRASEDAVQAAIRMKYATGLYGIDPHVKVSLPESIAACELEKALVAVHESGVNANSEVGVSYTRALVLERFAKFYRNGEGCFTRER